ncbi:MAG: hypothetical protein EZS28_017544 [Streblomastix strix]|uniref:Uncharacterized protein n=1 Tax=Streblomastix strix TaxID=222440 RepID=A0A5J4VXB7_9EUKA|nr:MAG: hypothetical protein EZS28_017544 [Streblomastix strix]
MALALQLLIFVHINQKLTEIYEFHVAVRVCTKLGAQSMFSYKKQIRALWRELNAISEIIVSNRMLESLFELKNLELMRQYRKAGRRKEIFPIAGDFPTWMRCFLLQRDDQVTQQWCQPREHGRMEVNKDQIQRYRHNLEEHIVGKLTCAISATDQSGCQDWPDTHPQLMLVTANATPGQLTNKLKRDGQLFTAMPCITLQLYTDQREK